MPEFSPEELAAEAVTADTPPAPQPPEQQAPAQPRDESGRFAPTERTDEPAQPPVEGERTRQVPHAALHGEREAHKQTKAERDQLRATLNQLAELRQRVAAAQQPSPEPVAPHLPEPAQAAPVDGQQPPPQPQLDNGMTHLQQRLAQLEQAREQDVQHRNIEVINQQEEQIIHAAVTQADAEFSARQPDYTAAVNYLIQSRARELQRYGLQPLEIQATLQDEAMQIARGAIVQGVSPAEMAYEIAKDRGWNGQAQQPSGGQNDATRMLDAIAAGQKGSKSLGAMSGGAPAGQISADMLGQMSEAEFAKLYSTPEGKALIDSMG